MIVHLATQTPRHILGRGKEDAFSDKDYGSRDNLLWVKMNSESGEITSAPNYRIRMQSNGTIGRGILPAVNAFEYKVYLVTFRGEDNPGPKEVAR